MTTWRAPRTDPAPPVTTGPAPVTTGPVPTGPGPVTGRAPASSPAATPRPSRAPALALLAVSVAACAVAVVVGGAAAPPVGGLGDAGAVVRWGLPVLRVVQDVAAALTVGLLVVAGLLLPGRQASRAMLVAARYATATGVVWVAAEVVGVVLGFADISGIAVGGRGFWTQLGAYAWGFENLRVLAISAAVAAAATILAAVSLARRGIATAAVLAVVALVPLALGGHTGGTADHETVVNALAAHLVGASLWVGGLLAIVLLRPLVGGHLTAVVSRFSAMALWCFAAVAVSGVVDGVVRLGGVADLGWLASAYGALLVVKATCLVVLGALGWQQRRLVVGRLGTDGPTRRLFTRFAVSELVVMAVAFGFATALARTPPPDPGPQLPPSPVLQLTGFPEPAAPEGQTWLTLWRFDSLWGVVAILAVGVYVAWVVRLRRRGDRWSVLRLLAWVGGWAAFFWAASGAPGVLGRVSFSWHMIEHMTISMYAPALLVLAAPVSLALRALPARADGSLGPRELLLGIVHSRALRVLGNPIVAAGLFFGSLAVFYYSPLLELALTTHTGHVLMVAHFLLTGYLFAWVLVGRDPGPPKWAPSLRLLIMLITVSFHAFFGVGLMSGTTLLAPEFFQALHLSWVPDPLADQQAAGSIAWAVGELPVLALSMVVVADWIRADSRESKRHDRRAARDGDAELAAYNARLQELARRGQRPGP